jgi:hypothetical protein
MDTAPMPGNPRELADYFPSPDPAAKQRARLKFRLDVTGIEGPLADCPEVKAPPPVEVEPVPEEWETAVSIAGRFAPPCDDDPGDAIGRVVGHAFSIGLTHASSLVHIDAGVWSYAPAAVRLIERRLVSRGYTLRAGGAL